MKHITLILLFILSVTFITCTSDVDDIYPEIDLSIVDGFPQNCDTIYRGQEFQFKARFSDNVELGSYSLEIHNNFDHHSHSTEAQECELGEKKEAINAWYYLEQFDIPENSSTFTAEQTIQVPEEVDSGDYHFQIRLTDHEGWQSLKGLSIKIL